MFLLLAMINFWSSSNNSQVKRQILFCEFDTNSRTVFINTEFFLIALQYQVLGVSNDLPNKCNFLDLCYESEFTRGFLEIEMNLRSYSSDCNLGRFIKYSKIVCRIFGTKINSNIFVFLLSISMHPLSPMKRLRCILIEFPSPYLPDSNS